MSATKRCHVRPDEQRSGALQGRSLCYLPPSISDKSGDQTSNNYNNMQNHVKIVNGDGNNITVQQRTSSRWQFLQSISTDSSLCESTCCIGKYSIKITGDHFELVQMAKLALDDYFRSDKFLQSAAYKEMTNQTSSHSTPTMIACATTPISKMKSLPPFTDNTMGFNIENVSRISNSNESATAVNQSMVYDVTRSRRTHFSRKNLQEEIIVTDNRELSALPETMPIIDKYDQLQLPRKDSAPEGNMIAVTKDLCAVPIANALTRSPRTHFTRKDLEKEILMTDNKVLCAEAIPIVHKYERLQLPRKNSTSEGDMMTDTKALCTVPFATRTNLGGERLWPLIVRNMSKQQVQS